MTDKEIEEYCLKAFAEFTIQMKAQHSIPILLLAGTVDDDDSEIFQLCTKSIPCEKMIKCLHNAIKNCHKEILEKNITKCKLN